MKTFLPPHGPLVFTFFPFFDQRAQHDPHRRVHTGFSGATLHACHRAQGAVGMESVDRHAHRDHRHRGARLSDAASWFSAWSHDTDVDGYVQSVEQIPDAAVDEMLAAADEYNENLPTGPLRDPYALGADGQQTAIGEGASAYFDTLSADGTDTMARIRIPSIHVDLPIFHGTDEETLSRGIGHLYGSSLPVGGSGTHSVLTGHNGFVQATLFDDIDELVEGDIIVVSTLGRDLYYEVDQTKTVLPNDAGGFAPGRRQGLPDARHLHAHGRQHPPSSGARRAHRRSDRGISVTTIADTTDPAGFPWWALLVVGVPVLTFIVVMPRRGRKNRSGRRATHRAAESDS